jgi:phosphoribosyl 1,2-cyclic phosphodiesterase
LLQKALNYNLDKIDGCLLTHEHQDHCRAVRDIIKAGIDIYGSEGTLTDIFGDHILIETRRAIIIHKPIQQINSFVVFPFDIIHDATEPYGYVIHDTSDGEWLLFCPDSSYLKQRFNCKFTIIALECSYDAEILRQRVETKDIHEEVAKRIVQSHAEKNTTLDYLQKFCDLSRCQQIHLLHTSGDNLDKKATKEEFEKKLFIETVILKGSSGPKTIMPARFRAKMRLFRR